MDRKTAVNFLRKKYFVLSKYMALSFFVFFTAALVLKFPTEAGEGIVSGINLCLYTLIPSLYPFMLISNFCAEAGVLPGDNKVVDFITKKLFALPGKCASVILFSLVGGLPVGVKMAQTLFQKGMITERQGKRLMLFCVNPGPAFVISYVGATLYRSEKTGLILYVSIIASSLILGILSRFVFPDEAESKTSETVQYESCVTALKNSVTKSSRNLFEISSWVIAFSCVLVLAEKIVSNGELLFLLRCMLEITTGCKNAAAVLSVPAVAGVIGFSGVCAHFQLWTSFSSVGLRYKYFFVSRTVNAALSILICKALTTLFVVEVETIAIGVRPSAADNSASAIVSVMTVLMSALFLIGDNYTVRKNKGVKF